MAKTKTVYICNNCGNDSPKWIGKCPVCGEWNTYVEEHITKSSSSKGHDIFETNNSKPLKLREVTSGEDPRINLHDGELNRVLGGGLVPGSLVLLGGEPGIGKSTLILQTVLGLSNIKTLYISGE